MKRIFLVLLIVLMAGINVFAATPLRRLFTVSQSDGTQVQVRRVGDGHIGFYATSDGWALLRNSAGDLCYVQSAGGDSLTVSAVVAHNVGERQTEETDFIAQSAISVADAFSLRNGGGGTAPVSTRSTNAPQSNGLGVYGQSANGDVPSVGDVVIPVIMVEFPDLPFSLADEETLDEQMNSDSYTDKYGSVGSLREYFVDNSYGLFRPEFRIVGRMTAQYDHDYYGANSSDGTIDVNKINLLSECLDYLTQAGIDPSDFTVNGSIPLLTIYYAGEGEHAAYGSDADDLLWASMASVSGASISGTTLKSFLVVNEELCSYSGDTQVASYLNGIGVFAHEFCHALGLPDVYDVYSSTDAQGNYLVQAMDFWSLMDNGEWWYDGFVPTPLTAYERNVLGWLEIEDLTEAGSYELRPLSDEEGTRAYRIVNSEGSGLEYYILENRKPDNKWFSSLMGAGMLVTHIDYNATLWRYNTVNTNASRLRYTYIPADNSKNYYSASGSLDFSMIAGDLWDGTDGKTELTDTSTPAAEVNNGDYMGQPLYNIALVDNVVSFDFLEATATGISSPVVDGAVTVFTIDGRRVLEAKSVAEASKGLSKGIYLFQSATGTRKMVIK